MSTLRNSQAISFQGYRRLQTAGADHCGYWGLATSRSFAAAKRRRERILACVALVMLIVAWDASLRLDEQSSPPRMRVSHAVEVESDLQAMTSAQ
jgi:hypothetical protein